MDRPIPKGKAEVRRERAWTRRARCSFLSIRARSQPHHSSPIHLHSSFQLPLSTLAFLFSEIVQHAQAGAASLPDLERRLADLGRPVGASLLELLAWRERAGRREVRLLDALKFIHSTLWRALAGHPARDLEQSNAAEDEYMISDPDLPLNRSISVPRDFGGLNAGGAFAAGVVAGALAAAGFPARVTAHWVEAGPPGGGGAGGGLAGGGGSGPGSSQAGAASSASASSAPRSSAPQKTTILIKFDPAVMAREARLAAAG